MLITLDGKSPTIGKDVFIAPTAVLIGDVKIGDGSSVWFGAVLRADYGPITVGANCSIQDNSVIHSYAEFPTVIDDNVTIGHNVTAEGCHIKSDTLIGVGARILPYSTIGERVVVAANAVVLERSDIPSGVLVAGAPAKIKKELSGRSLEWNDFAINAYRGMQAKYRAEGIDRLAP